MTTIATFTTVWKRPEITSIMMSALAEFQSVSQARYDVIINPFFVLSPDDPNRHQFLSIIRDYGWDYCFKPNSPLGDKAQKGFNELKIRPFDYLMHIDTDDIVSPNIFTFFEPFMKRKTPWFGSVDKHILDTESGALYYFEGYPNTRMSVNGGRMVSRHALQKCGWQQWTSGIEFGLNYHQKIYLEKQGFEESLFRTKANPCILELKSQVNIHGIQWFHENTAGRLKALSLDGLEMFDPKVASLFG